MSSTRCKAKDKDNCRFHQTGKYAVAPVTPPKPKTLAERVAEEIARNKLRKEAEAQAMLAQEASERSKDWSNYGFQTPNEPRVTEENYEFFSRSKEELANLSEKELHVLRFYSSNNYKWINSSLHGRTQLSEDDTDTRSLYDYKVDGMTQQEINKTPSSKHAQEVYKALDSVLAKAPKEEKVLYRGKNLNDPLLSGMKPEQLHEYVDANYIPGSVITSPGYMSTSPSAQAAMSYANTVDSLGVKREGLFFEMKTSKGLNISSASIYSRETEVLVPRDTKWKIVAVHKSKTITTVTQSKRTGSKNKKVNKVTLIQMVEVE